MPKTTFADLGVPAELVTILREDGHRAPTLVQAATLPDAIAGKDIIGRAPARTGTTLAFGLALILRTKRAKTNRPTALVLVPDRKLAFKIQRELHRVAATRGLRVGTACETTTVDKQRQALRHGVEILVAVPGALDEMLEQRDLRLDDIDIVVIDEADKMAALGQLPIVEKLLDLVTVTRQTMVFTSRMGGAVEELVKARTRNPRMIDVMTRAEDEKHPWVEFEPAPSPNGDTVSVGSSSGRMLDTVDASSRPGERTTTGRARRHRSSGLRRVR